jgi:hypothetical protein
LLEQVVQAAAHIVMLPAVFPIKPPRVLHPTVQQLLPTAEMVVHQRTAAMEVAVAAVVPPKLEQLALVSEVQARVAESAEKAAKESLTHCGLIRRLCTALVVAAKEDG